MATSDFTQPGFENGSTNMGSDYTAGGTNGFTVNSSNEGTWIFGNVNGSNNAYKLNDTDVAGNTIIYVSDIKPSKLRGFVQHVDAGAGKWTGDTQFSIDYVGQGTVALPHGFAFAAFAWDDGTDPGINIHGPSGLLFVNDGTYLGLDNHVFTSGDLPTVFAETTVSVSTNQLGDNPWNTATSSLDLGGTGYDNVAVLIATEGSNDSHIYFDKLAVGAVPEPSTTALLGLGGLALILRRRK
jgi:hypothetical protein